MAWKPNASSVQLAIQTAKGTIPANPAYDVRVLAGTALGPDRNIQTKRTAEGSRASDGIAVVGDMGGGGTLNGVIQLKNLPYLLRMCGFAIATTGSADPYSHAATPEQTAGLPWVAAWVKVDTKRMLIPNLKVNTAKFLVSSADRLVVFNMELLGAGAVQHKTAAPTTPATPEPVADIYSWDQAKAAWVLDTVTVGYIHTFEFAVNNNLTGIPGEDFFFYDVQEGPLDLDYKAVITIVDASKYNTMIWGSASPSDAAEPTATIATGSLATKFTKTAASPGPERSLAFAVTASEYRNALPKLAIDPDGKPQDLSLEARCTGTDPKVTITVKNGVASYA